MGKITCKFFNIIMNLEVFFKLEIFFNFGHTCVYRGATYFHPWWTQGGRTRMMGHHRRGKDKVLPHHDGSIVSGDIVFYHLFPPNKGVKSVSNSLRNKKIFQIL